MMDATLDRMRDIVQNDAGNRGLRTDPRRNLVSETAGDFRAACRGLADVPAPVLGIVTGFFIPTSDPPAAETDGPAGAVFLARALAPLGGRVILASDAFCTSALRAGVAVCGLGRDAPVVTLPSPADARQQTPDEYYESFLRSAGDSRLTHLFAIERVGPSHTPASVQAQDRASSQDTARAFLAEVPPEHFDRCHTMRGIDVTERVSPAHWLFEAAAQHGVATIGIGDGGNEIGMGRIAWDVIRGNIPRGGLVACRVPTDHLIVAGVSNWGAYALAAGLYALRGTTPPADLFDPDVERRILEVMVREGPLVDAGLGKPSATVDGLSWERYAAVLPALRAALDVR